MNKNIITRLYWILWFITTILTGILSGFMISHSLILGGFFTWCIESSNLDLIRKGFSIYRETDNYKLLYLFYYSPILISLVSGPAWVVLAFLKKRYRGISLIAGLSTYWVSVIFVGTGFGKVEKAVMKGLADDATRQFFVNFNVPIHTCNAIIYSVSFLLLLFVVLKKE
jgi:hypothetical protein